MTIDGDRLTARAWCTHGTTTIVGRVKFKSGPVSQNNLQAFPAQCFLVGEGFVAAFFSADGTMRHAYEG